VKGSRVVLWLPALLLMGGTSAAHIAADVKRWSAFLERAQIKLE
jgi:hypothetical protein